MELQFKPDFDRARTYWEAFWNREIIDRPCVSITAPKEPANPREPPSVLNAVDGRYLESLQRFERWVASTHFGGEAIPFYQVNFGPDQFSAFIGAELVMSEDHGTSWVKPFVTDWQTVQIRIREEESSIWIQMLNYLQLADRFSKGKFLVGMIDLHSNMDCLMAIRGTQALCMDLIDRPHDVERVLTEVRALFPRVYDAIYEAGDMRSRGCVGWAPFYSTGKFCTIQCDFIFMVSPEHARRFAIPALAEEASFLDHSVYHLDGPGALVHLNDILAIPDIDVIQWVPGAGNGRMIDWIDLLKTIQAAGKGLQIGCTPEELKRFHRELRPEGVLYCCGTASVQESDELLDWLQSNT